MPGISDDERRGDWRIWARPYWLAQNRLQKRRKCSKVGRVLPCAFLLFADDFSSNAASRADTQQTLSSRTWIVFEQGIQKMILPLAVDHQVASRETFASKTEFLQQSHRSHIGRQA